MHTCKLTTIDQKALELLITAILTVKFHYCYTCYKISVLVVLIIEAYDEIPFAQNHPSIETSIRLFFFSVFLITPLHKNACTFFVYPI